MYFKVVGSGFWGMSRKVPKKSGQGLAAGLYFTTEVDLIPCQRPGPSLSPAIRGTYYEPSEQANQELRKALL